MDKCNVVSLNVRGLGNDVKRKEVFHYFRKKKVDIICLQETHAEAESLELYSKQWACGKCFLSCGNSKSRGVAILINNDIKN